MNEPARIGWRRGAPLDALSTREWLVANGLGGYACGTLGGVGTRRFHGLLVAALPAPLGRVLMVSHLNDRAIFPDGSTFLLTGTETTAGDLTLPDPSFLEEVRFELGLPVWRYSRNGVILEKRIVLPHARNTSHVVYRLVESPFPIELELAPALYVRHHEAAIACDPLLVYPAKQEGERLEISPGNGVPPLDMFVEGARSTAILAPRVTPDLMYREERGRGYDYHGVLHVPGRFAFELAPGGQASFVMSIEHGPHGPIASGAEVLAAEQSRRRALLMAATPAARVGIGAEFVLAADQFVIKPLTRVADSDRAHAEGSKARTVIAGYHWFTDWGRDTMISLDGLTLVTGRHAEACHILRTFAHHVKDGLLPNMFPEGGREGLYHTADATMWFFHAIERYVDATGDRATLRTLLPILKDILHHHIVGTHFGIRVDPRDGLLTQGADGYQLTWMDAKVDGWVVTPRRGKAVEINALFYNALCVLAKFVREEDGEAEAAPIVARAEQARASFNARFWCEERRHLYDVVDGEQGNDPAIRPNQILALSLPHPVLDEKHWAAVVDVVRAKLLTPVGLRSLSPDHPDYRGKYDGDLRARDAAYHQGTVWGWLIGPFVDAWLRVHPRDREGARDLVLQLAPHLGEACVGSISEIFDAEVPYLPRGCVAQAWSVAEALRVFVRTATRVEEQVDEDARK